MAGKMSTKVNPADARMAQHIRDELNRTDAEIKRLNERRGVLLTMQSVLRICNRCGGSGTICETRTEDDSPWYEECPGCGGKGHGRN